MEYMLFLQHLRESSPSFVNSIFVFISEVLVAAVILIPALVYWCGDKKTGQWMFLNYSGAYMVNQIVKNSVCLYRPWIRNPKLTLAPEAVKSATGYSFPSGHTTFATTTMESLIVWQRKRKWVVILCTIFIFLVAFARNWLGAHTQYDVMAAILEVSVIVILNIFLCRAFDGKTDKDWLLVIIGIAGLVCVMLYLQFKKYPIDYDATGKILVDPYDMLTDCYTGAGLFSGFLIGWLLENRFVKFDHEVSVKQLVLRGVIGSIILGLLYAVILPLAVCMANPHLGHFIKYFVLIIYAVFLFPLCFNAIEKKSAKKVSE